MQQEIKSYQVVPSMRTREEIVDQYNETLYIAYGPDQSLKPGPVRITVDALCEYERLLDTLVEMGAEGIPLSEMHESPCPDGKVICGIRHDLDMDFRASLDMARLEQERGIRSSWYILHTAPYYGDLDETGVFHRNEAMASVYLELQGMGHEVGLHIDGFHLYQNHKIDGAEAIVTELEWMRSIGLNIVGTAAHNMSTVYGAENYAIFSGRPFKGGIVSPDQPVEVIKDGKWAPAGVLSESDLGLRYEANDLFHQGETSVFYGAIRGLDSWRRVHEMSSPLAREKDDRISGFTDTGTFLREMRAVENGRFIVLAVHPIYYGARHSSRSAPSRFLDRGGASISREIGWEVHNPRSIQARSGTSVDGKQEFQSINMANEYGQLDFPFLPADSAADLRVLFLGGTNMDGASCGLPAQVHVRSKEQIEQKNKDRRVQTWKFAGPEMGISKLFGWFSKLRDQCAPTHVVLGIGADELLHSIPEYWNLAGGFDPHVPPGDYLNVNSDGVVSLVESQDGAVLLRRQSTGEDGAVPWLHSQPEEAGLQDKIADGIDSLCRILHHWQEACDSLGCELILFLENCGETVNREIAQSASLLEEAHLQMLKHILPLANKTGVALVDPYPELLKVREDAFYEANSEWNPHGHFVAAGVLASSLRGASKEKSEWLRKVKSSKPLAIKCRPNEQFLTTLEAKATAAGVRKLPYPFANALAITSDIDKSNREKYSAYTKELVDDFGFDFGDSIWLTSGLSEVGKVRKHPGMAFFTPWLTHFEETWPDAGVLDSFDIAREHHLGNIDHWHTFMRRGPRCAFVTDFREEVNGKIVGTPPENPSPRPTSEHKTGRDYFDSRDFYVLAATVIGEWDANGGPESITLVAEGRSKEFKLLPGGDPLDEVNGLKVDHCCFVAKVGPDDGKVVPHLTEVVNVEIQFPKAFQSSGAKVERVIFHNTHPDLLTDRFDYLASHFHFSTNLVTRHSVFHILPEIPGFGGAGQGEVMMERMARHPEILDTYYGSLFEFDIPCSTSIDEPGSFARLFPYLLREHGIQFLRSNAIDYPKTMRVSVSQAAHALRDRKSGEKREPKNHVGPEPVGWHPKISGVVFPVSTRDGGGVYHLRSTHSRPVDPEKNDRELNKNLARKTIARNFTNRLGSVLEDLGKISGSACQFYTHLGNLAPDDDNLPEPYFEKKELTELQDRVYGAGKSQDSRIWFTRASVLCDYSVVFQSIGEHLSRPRSNSIEIEPWVDSFCGAEVAGNACELYGQTFYVDDSTTAKVKLGGETIRELVRNPADDTGKASVTVAVCPIRHTVFRGIDPRVRVGEDELNWQCRSLEAKWASDFGFALSPEKGGAGGVRFSPCITDAAGCQHLMFNLKRESAASRFLILLQTSTNGVFAFGDAEMLDKSTESWTATYSFPDGMGKIGEWETFVVPFYDMKWADEESSEGRPLPSHSLSNLEIRVEGGDIGISSLELGRPRTTRAAAVSGDHVKIGVRVGEQYCDSDFELLPAGAKKVETPAAVARPNSAGHLIFDAVPKGGYRICLSSDSDNTLQWVEAFSDRFDLKIL